MRAAPPMMLTMLPCAALSSGQNSSRQPHRGVELEREAVGPGLVRLLEEFSAFGRAGIVDQHVAALEALVHLGEHLLAAGKRAQIAGNRHRRRPARRGDRLRAFGEIGRVRRRQHGLRALAREGGRDGPADAAAAAADDDDFSLEFSRHWLPPLISAGLYTRPAPRPRGVGRIDLPAFPVTIRKKTGRENVKPAPFAYKKARSLEEAVALLGEHKDDARLLAGGQSLIATLNMRLSAPALLIDINGISGLDGIALQGRHGRDRRAGAPCRRPSVPS